ncbi:MAG: tripartite tricarboxylate transporter TctB family protein [Pseudomonadota bacterium]
MSFTKNYDRIVGIVLLIVIAILFANTFTFKTRPFVPLNTTFWPRVILALIGVVAVYLVIRGRATDEAPEKFSPRAGLVFLGAAGYVLLMPIGGFLIVSTLVGAIGYYWLSEQKDVRTLLFAAVYGALTSSLIYIVFKELLHVQLPFAGGF